MPPLRLVGLFLFGCLWMLPGQPRYRFDHLVTTAMLWNAVRFTHPWLCSGNPDPKKPAIDWDGALHTAVYRVLYAQTQPEVRAALEAMLGSLGDPATALVARPGARRADSSKPPDFSAQLTAEGVLVIRAGRGDDPNLRQKIRDSISVVIDWRGIGPYDNYNLRGGYFVNRNAGPVRIREFRVTGSPFEGNLLTRMGPAVSPAGGQMRYVVFLVDGASAIPDWPIAMEAQGQASIVGTDPESEWVGIPRLHLPTPEAWIRSGDYVYPDGSTGGYLNRALHAEKRKEDPVEAAVAMAMTGAVPPPLSRFRLPPAIPFRPSRVEAGDGYPPVEQRLAAAIQIWGVFEYFFPHNQISGDDWTEALRQELQHFEDARDAREYHLAVARLVSRARDRNSYATSLLISPPPPVTSPRRSGRTFRVDENQNGYADLTRLEDQEVGPMWEAFRGASAIYFDLRGVVRNSLFEGPHSILSRLVDSGGLRGEKSAVQGLQAGRRTTIDSVASMPPPARDWTFRGKTFGIVDEGTVGESERAGLRLEAANGTRFAGPAPSAGAAGAVSTFGVAGGITIRFTAERVLHWDGRRLQRVGLQPDAKAPAEFLNAQ